MHDGLWDIYNNQHMGMCGEDCASKMGFTRQDQDQFAARSFDRCTPLTLYVMCYMLCLEVFVCRVD